MAVAHGLLEVCECVYALYAEISWYLEMQHIICHKMIKLVSG